MNKLNILHYSFGLPPKANGGLPLFVRDLISMEKEYGHNVNILLPKQCLFGKDSIYLKNDIYYINNSLPVPSIFGVKNPSELMRKYNQRVIIEFLDHLNLDVIHLHTLMGLPKELLVIAKSKGIKLVYTTHDYYGLCLKCNFIDFKGHVCDSEDSELCTKCNKVNGIDKKMMYLIGSEFYKKIKKNKFIYILKSKVRKDNSLQGLGAYNKCIVVSGEEVKQYYRLKKYYKEMFLLIDIFHYNSSVSKEVYEKHLPTISGKVISISLNHIIDNRKKHTKIIGNAITYGYIGRKEPYKGINILVDALEVLNKNGKDFQCFLYGDDFSNYNNLFNGKIINKGEYLNLEIDKVFNSIDILVVPSIWKETFGLIVLEALSFGIPVVVNNSVGSKDILENKFGIIIDNIDSEKLSDVLGEINKETIDRLTSNIKENLEFIYFKDKVQDIISKCYL